MTYNSIMRYIYALVAGALLLVACNHSEPSAPTGTAGRVTCYEDEVAMPRQWQPGTPKDGVTWDCVHVDVLRDLLTNHDEDGVYVGPM